MRDGLLGRDPRLRLRIVEPLQPGVRIVEPPTVQRVAATRIAARRGEFDGRVQLLHRVIFRWRATSSLRLAALTPIRGTAPRSASGSSRDALSARSVGTRKSGATGSSTSRI